MTHPSLPLTHGAFFVSNSSLETLQQCPTKYAYSKLWSRVSASPQGALTFGQAGHKVWAWRYACLSGSAVTPTFQQQQIRLIDWFLKKNPLPDGPDEFRNLNWGIKCFIEKYNERYKEEPWSVLKDSNNKPYVETSFCFKLYDQGLIPVYYHGIIDLVVTWNGRILVIDHKTASMLGKTWEDAKRVEPQYLGYCWAWWKTTGIPPTGFLVNAVRCKPAPLKFPKGEAFWWAENYNRSVIEYPSLDDLLEWEANTIEQVKNLFYRAEVGAYPQHKNQCVPKYGRCAYYDVCALPAGKREAVLLGNAFKPNISPFQAEEPVIE